MFHIRLSIFCFLIFNITQTEFKRTRDEELREYSRDKCIQKYDTCSEDVIKYMYYGYLANIENGDNYLITIDEFYNKTGYDVLDIQIAFNRLKKLMSIPDEVQLFVVTDNDFFYDGGRTIACYSIWRRAVVLNKILLNDCKSRQLFTLIHELTHCQQHMMRDAIISRDSRFDKEREADTQAAMAIQCPVCLWRIQLVLDCDESEGYLGKLGLKKFTNSKSFNDLCDGCKKDSSDLGLYLSNIDCSGCKLKK